MEPTVIEHENFTRRRRVTKFALAGVAVLGVGAVLTSAAWSDNVWFGGDADAADFELSGFDPVNRTWLPADTASTAVGLPGDRAGVSDQTIYDWRNQDRIDRGLRAGVSTAESAELTAARKRIHELETELAVTTRANELLKAQSDPRGVGRSSRKS